MTTTYDEDEKPLDPKDYTVVWFAPLYIEARAALLLLDEKHDGEFETDDTDDYIYTAGTMRGHKVVIAQLPEGEMYGTVSAAHIAAHVKKFFPNLRFGLLVGIAAGLPNLENGRDIRLGDVLVAVPSGNTPGVLPYDLGKDHGGGGGPDEFELSRGGYSLAESAKLVRSAASKLRTDPEKCSKRMLSYYQLVKNKTHEQGDFSDPGQDCDLLYESGEDEEDREVDRAVRSKDNRTRVWYGGIGSGQKLIRNRRTRDEYRDRHNLIGLEMEAAGTMNAIPVGVIRGVCDYADHRKNKIWQPYAAAMAASYAKTILHEIRPRKVEGLGGGGRPNGSVSPAPGGTPQYQHIHNNFTGNGIQSSGNSRLNVGGQINIGNAYR